MTYDQAAVTLLLRNDQRGLTRLAKRAKITIGDQCPECESTETESNGCRGNDLEFRCCECDRRWGPATEV